MTSDLVTCSEAHCSSTDTFLCVKHCQQYVCFNHLQEHHRRYEQEKSDLPKELHRRVQQRFSLYNRLIDVTKLNEQERRDIEIACTEIRRTYEERRQDHQQLQSEGMSILEPTASIKDRQSYLERLDVAIEREQQRERVYSQINGSVNIKLEPNDFNDHENNTEYVVPNSSESTMENKDNQSQGSWAGEDEEDGELSDLDEADSDYDGRRKRSSLTSDAERSLNQSVTIYRGCCPLTRPGLFGILPVHNIRTCEGKSSCLYNHLQSFHHMTARSSYKLCQAVLKHRDPLLTSLFQRDDVLYNKDFHIACPFNLDAKNPFDCQPKYILKAPCSSIISRLDMPRHLRDVHHVYRPAALKIVAEMRRCLKTNDAKTGWNLNRTLFQKGENIIESFDGKDSPQTSKRRK